ncbi:MAG: entericidin A/B family lipoprotein [Verrucomicrobiota bacterium]
MRAIILKPAVLVICVATLVIITTSGCKHTAQGAGKDIEQVGEKIQEKTK